MRWIRISRSLPHHHQPSKQLPIRCVYVCISVCVCVCEGEGCVCVCVMWNARCHVILCNVMYCHWT
jgi:hypothetical protein